ncbi:MAG: glucose-1-phosphate thymidylyltransferase [Candidatus Brocadiae bacterium]|nr:glucose-1-phosphate thymidylyltransferase [Candidatus Brocadiia bacterium]
MTGDIVVFEDHYVEDMWPITLTRPGWAVTCGAYNLREVAALAGERVSCVVRGYLKKIAARSLAGSPREDGPTLFLNAAVAPDVRYVARLRELLAEAQPFMCTAGHRVAAAMLRVGEQVPEDLSSETVTPYLLSLNLPLRDGEPFRTFDYPFHVIGALEELLPANVEHRIEADGFRELRPGVFVGEGVSVAETAVFHADDGPIVLGDGVRVLDFTYFEGPVYVGPRSRIIERSSVKQSVSIGHTCKIGGEVEATVIEPYANKQHHGFLGHSYLGSWVNLGAGTSNSDLKNTYGEVRIQHRGRRIETGMQFVGCVIGDYAKSAINTSIFTGKTVGAASMLYGYVGQDVPSFCNYAKSFGQVTEVTLEQAVITQKRMFARRDVEQTEDDIALLATIFELTREERMISAEPPAL